MVRLTTKHMLAYCVLILWIKYGYQPTLSICIIYAIGLGSLVF